MKVRIYAGLLSITGGLVLVAMWLFLFFNIQQFSDAGLKGISDHIVSMLSYEGTLEFFRYSVLCVLGSFFSGALFLSGKYQGLGIAVVLANSVAVSIIYAWFIAALIASPLVFTYWVLKNTEPQV